MIEPFILYSCLTALIVFWCLIKINQQITKANNDKKIYQDILKIVNYQTFLDLQKCKQAKDSLIKIEQNKLPVYIKDYINGTIGNLNNTIEVYEKSNNRDLESVLKEMNDQVEQMLNIINSKKDTYGIP